MTTSNSTGGISVTVTTTTTTGGGGGGGSASTNPSTSKTWTTIEKGENSMSISTDDFGVKDVSFKTKNSTSNAKINIEKLSERPAATIEISGDGKVFRYLEITVTNINFEGKIKIKFIVTQGWLLSNNVKAEDIVLKRFVDGKWVDLPTRIVSTGTTQVTFEADSPRFSYFAIGTKAPEEPVEEEVEEEEVVTEEPPEEEKPAIILEEEEAPPVNEVVEEKKKPSALGTILIVIAMFILIVMIILTITRKKKPAVFEEYEKKYEKAAHEHHKSEHHHKPAHEHSEHREHKHE